VEKSFPFHFYIVSTKWLATALTSTQIAVLPWQYAVEMSPQ